MSKNFIEGIYNYCDRWCERCTFTSRCRNYASTSKLSPEQLDMNNKAFWDNISANFSNATRILRKAAKKHGIDMDKPMTEQEEQEYERHERFLRQATNNHELIKLCKQYEKTVLPFVDQREQLTEKARELARSVHMGIQDEEVVLNIVKDISDSVEIIQWYLFFIDAKLQRALHGKLEDREHDYDFPKDSDGSAKIAILAIERSMNAWMRLFQSMSSAEDVALTSLSILTKLKEKAVEEFPDAMQFHRPGFDD
jgi:hypothetical protein